MLISSLSYSQSESTIYFNCFAKTSAHNDLFFAGKRK